MTAGCCLAASFCIRWSGGRHRRDGSRVVGGAADPAAQGLGCRAGPLPVQRSRAHAHRPREFAGRSASTSRKRTSRSRSSSCRRRRRDRSSSARSPAAVHPISAKCGTIGSASSRAWARSRISPRARSLGSTSRTCCRHRLANGDASTTRSSRCRWLVTLDGSTSAPTG